jgi:hypothetical protein
VGKIMGKGLLISFLLLLFIAGNGLSQEKRCIPNVWKAEEVKGWVYTNSGDTLEGKFAHLTPYNDIKTTHVIYHNGKKDKVYINRADVISYFDKSEKFVRLKVYVDTDSSIYKKGCFFDQGRFLEVVVQGEYTLLKDKLNYYSSIEAYSQSSSSDIYYILLPSHKLIEVQINDLKAQLLSLVIWEDDNEIFTNAESFTIEEMIELIEYLNLEN